MKEVKRNFRMYLKDSLFNIEREEHLDIKINENSGYVFSLFIAKMFMEWDVGLESDIHDVVSRGPNDKIVDIILQDDSSKTIHIIQTKYKGYGDKPKPIEREKALAFLSVHEALLEEETFKSANDFIKDNLSDYRNLLNNGWKARLYFVTTGKISDNNDIKNVYEKKNEALSKSKLHDVEFNIFDTNKLQEIYTEILSYEENIPEETEIDIPSKLFIEKTDAKYPFIVGLIKGNSLRNEYLKKGRKDSLFAWNIRKYLGDRGINKSIKSTASDEPEHFFYFNNGITAVCKDYELSGNKLKIKKFQIINGAQTVASIAKSPERDEVLVLFRLIKTGRVDTDSGINREIIQANNTQNAIRLSDFRANDLIQRWLESHIKEVRSEYLGSLTYQAKRTSKKGNGRIIKMEELAKIRFSYYHNPYIPNADPKSLWTLNSDQGKYNEAFGVDGAIEDSWSKEIIEECVFAIALHDKAIDEAKTEKSKDNEYQFFHRMRFHAVALAGLYYRAKLAEYSIHSMLGSNEKFNNFWNQLWKEMRGLFYLLHKKNCREREKPITLHALVRGESYWESLVDDFRFVTGIPKKKT